MTDVGNEASLAFDRASKAQQKFVHRGCQRSDLIMGLGYSYRFGNGPLGQACDFPAEPLHGLERRPRQKICSYPGQDDDKRASDGELCGHSTDGGIERFERYCRNDQPAFLTGIGLTEHSLTFAVVHDVHQNRVIPGLAEK